jgi:prepilin-type N-terminal cleavage/methylation domain-containing protein
MQRGFTLIEILVTVAILMIVFIGIYFLLDQGQWLYLESERKSKIQETGRLTIEQMERDFRMIGAGVPSGTGPGGAVWTPYIFTASVSTIGFTGDIDNGTDNLSRNIGAVDDSHIFLGDPSAYFLSYDANGDGTLDVPVKIILVSNSRSWEDLVAVGLDSNNTAVVTSSPVATPASYKAEDSTVHTLERVFYRMVNLSGNPQDDGICTDPFPFCTIQRQEYQTNNPAETNPEAESANAQWETIARNATFLEFTYFQADGTQIDPSSGPLSSIDKIRIKLIARDRSRRVAGGSSNPSLWQDSIMKSEVLIRNRKL